MAVRVSFTIDPDPDDSDDESDAGLTPLAADAILATLEEEFEAKRVAFERLEG